jgi:CDP-glucose 4,6-dehydratase
MESLVIDPAFWRDRRVLVTGHTGFKGSWLCLWLEELGAEVIGFSNGVPTTPSLYKDAAIDRGLSDVTGDIRDRVALRALLERRRPEIVFHLAAQSLVRRSYTYPLETYEMNVIGTANVLEASRGIAAAVVVVTSDKCYAPAPDHCSHKETDPLGGADPYSSSKACAELVALAYRSLFRDEGPAVASVRAGNVIGGGDWAEDRLLPDLVRGGLGGSMVPIRNPSAIRPWQHVLNPLEGYLLLGQCLRGDRAYAEAWNFGPDPADEVSVLSVAARFGELWEVEVITTRAKGADPPESHVIRLDSGKARDLLGWRPRWNLDDALYRVVEWTESYRRGKDLRRTMADQIRAHQKDVMPA